MGSFRQIETEVISQKSSRLLSGRSEETQKEKEGNKQKAKKLQQFQNQIAKSENQIEKLETAIKTIDEKLMHPEQYQEAVNDKDFFSNYEKLKKQLEEEMKKWEELLRTT